MPNGAMSCVGTATGFIVPDSGDVTTLTVTTDRARAIMREVTVTAGAELLSDADWNEITDEGAEETTSSDENAPNTDNAAFRTVAHHALATGLAVAVGGAMIVM